MHLDMVHSTIAPSPTLPSRFAAAPASLPPLAYHLAPSQAQAQRIFISHRSASATLQSHRATSTTMPFSIM